MLPPSLQLWVLHCHPAALLFFDICGRMVVVLNRHLQHAALS